MDDLDYFNELRKKYRFRWVSIDELVPNDGVPTIQVTGVRQMYARVYGKKKWIPIRDIEPILKEKFLGEDPPVPEGEVDYRKILKDLGARYTWATGHYLFVSIGEHLGLDPWSGWLSFTNKEPRVRKWGEGKRAKLHAAGAYAWIVEVSDKGHFRLHYSSPGRRNRYRTEWWHLSCLHQVLLEVTKHADANNWRDMELRETVWGYDPNSPSQFESSIKVRFSGESGLDENFQKNHK